MQPCSSSPTSETFPDASDTGWTEVAGPRTAVPSGATFGSGWTWTGTEVKITTANANVSNLDIAGGLLIQANGVTVSNCTIAGNATVGGTSAGTILNNNLVTNSGQSAACVTIAAGTTNTTVSNCTLTGVNATTGRVAYGVQDTSGNNGTLVESCQMIFCRVGGNAGGGQWLSNFIHNMGFVTGDHVDGIDVEGTNGGPLLIQGNSIQVNQNQTAALHMNTITGGTPNTNMTFNNNLVAGGDYSVYGGNSGPLASSCNNLVFTNNWFSTVFYPAGGSDGPATAFSATATGNVWSNNKWYDGLKTGQIVPS
jgi:hypothetical protein